MRRRARESISSKKIRNKKNTLLIHSTSFLCFPLTLGAFKENSIGRDFGIERGRESVFKRAHGYYWLFRNIDTYALTHSLEYWIIAIYGVFENKIKLLAYLACLQSIWLDGFKACHYQLFIIHDILYSFFPLVFLVPLFLALCSFDIGVKLDSFVVLFAC